MKCDGIAAAVMDGARVTITPDCWPARKNVVKVRVSMEKQTWNGVAMLNRNIPVTGEDPEKVEAAIAATVREMAESIELPHKRKG